MNIKPVLNSFGYLLLLLSILILLPVILMIMYNETGYIKFVFPSSLCFLTGCFLVKFYHSETEVRLREGIAIISVTWISYCIIGSLPYLMSSHMTSVVDAIFESVSGFTTTGSTVITNLDSFPKSLLFWRSFSQWIGGMGVIILALALLPFLKVGGMQILNKDIHGPTQEKLVPRIKTSLRIISTIYFFLTILLFGFLVFFGMPPFQAICTTFSTISTGGFSISNSGFLFTTNPMIFWTLSLFMILAATNFSLHYLAFRGKWDVYLKSNEFVSYILIVFIAISILGSINLSSDKNFFLYLSKTIFQTISFATTTGFYSTHYEKWSIFSQYILVVLIFIGGCAGSTSGGMKMIRIILLHKNSLIQIFRLIHPKGIKSLVFDSKPISENLIQSVLSFFILNIYLLVFGTFLISLTGLDILTAGSSILSNLLNLGTGFGLISPEGTYSSFTAMGKIILCFFMLIGRVEIFCFLVLFIPSFWRK